MGIRAGLGLMVCALGLAIARPATAQDALAEALALPVASALAGARDSARFAWVESAAGVRNVWTAERGSPARRVTAFASDDGQQISDLVLSADGSSLAFVRGGDAEFPDDRLPNAASDAAPPKQQLFVAQTAGGGPAPVGEGHSPEFAPSGNRLAFTRDGEIWLWDRSGGARKLATVTGEVRRLQWSPDGSRLLFVDHREDYSFVALFDVAQQRLKYLDPGLGFSEEPVFSPDGRQVAFVRYFTPPADAPSESGPYWSIRVADAASGAGRQLWAAPAGMGGRWMGTRSRNLFWSADGQIVFPWERSGWIHPYAIDAGKGGNPRDLTPGAFEVEAFLLGPDQRSIIYAANAGDLNRRHVWRRPLSGAGAVQSTSGDGIESAPTVAGDALAVIATDVSRPAFPALVGTSLSPLGRVAAARGFVAPEPVVFRAEDGVEVHGQLFRGRGSGKKPALVYIHGGPRRQMLLGFHPSGYYSNAYVMNQHLASKGYDVLAVNYRSGTGYGAAFRDAPEIGRGGASEYRDVLAAGRWLAARPEVDRSRIGVWGGSWGGYLTALAVARDSELFASGVDFHGVHTLLRAVPDSLSPDAQLAARRLQWQSSPMAAIDRWRSPILLIHGDDDKNVSFSQSVLLARELAARRIPFRDLVFPNERHGFFRHAHWLESLRATEAFFDRTLVRKQPLP
jgi:dipeptidyl aminopeptidase/acylaminoacyl peptidase